MSRLERKYALDTNLFIDGLRSPGAHRDLLRFHVAFAPFEYLSAVVAQELRSGVGSDRDLAVLATEILEPFEQRGRVVAPSYAAWSRAGDVLRRLARGSGLDLRRVSRAFSNDVLLATSCREAGVVLVTANTRDFSRIREVLPFEFVEPWPSSRG